VREDLPIIAVTRRLPGEIAVDGAATRVFEDGTPTRGQTLELVRGAAGLITWATDRVDAELMQAAGDQLQVVSNYAVGFDNIDLEFCRARGISVTNTPDVVTEGTANIAIALMLGAGRRVVEGDRYARSGRWAQDGGLGPAEFLGVDFTGRLFVVLGAGRIGLATAHRARAFGMRIAYVARSRHLDFELAPLGAERLDLEDALERADVLSIHCPLTPDTRGMIDAHALGRMKPTALLVNTARGPIVDEAALAAAIREGRLFGAGLDVFEHEPRVHDDLVELDRVVMTPHIGSAEDRWRREMTRTACANAAAVLAGREPISRVV